MTLSPRIINSLMLIFCATLMGFGLYLQYAKNLEPCPLCMTQRLCFIATGFFALIAAAHNPAIKGRRVYASLTLLTSLLGLWTASRQVWLQHLPEDKVPACGPGLEVMFDYFPFLEVLKTMLMGDGNCAEVVWTFLGLSIPEWSLLCFIALVTASLLLIFQKQAQSPEELP